MKAACFGVPFKIAASILPGLLILFPVITAQQPNPNRETTVALEPGPYHLALVVKDIDSGKTGVMYTTFEVPGYEELGKQEH
jgi:hypothetical protein